MSLDVAEHAVEILRQLVAIPSENPPGGEEQIASRVRALLRRAGGFEISTVVAAPGRPNVIAVARGGLPGPRLILQAHLDTKPADHSTWSIAPFAATMADGKLFGVGASDTKGGAAAQLAAAIAFRRENPRFPGELVWQGVADEENGSVVGAAELARRGLLAADAALVAEPTDLALAVAQLGNAWAEVTIRGRAAHAGLPWVGRSATRAAFELTRAIEQELVTWPQDPRFPGHPQLNLGRIDGGTHPGTVASRCTLLLDVRLRPGERRRQVFDLLGDCARDVEQRLEVKVEVRSYAGGGFEPHALDSDHPFLTLLEETWAEVEPAPARRSVLFGATDARFFETAGTPSVVFGPGSLAQAHAADEYVELAQVERAAHFLRHFLDRFHRR